MATSLGYPSCDDVYINYFVSPSEFFVTRVHDDAIHSEIQQIIHDTLVEGKMEKPRPKLTLRAPPSDDEQSLMTEYSKERQEDIDLETGQMVLALSRAPRSAFLRGLILDKYVEYVLGLHYKIKFVDIGHTEWVHTDNIFLMPEILTKFEPLAYECAG